MKKTLLTILLITSALITGCNQSGTTDNKVASTPQSTFATGKDLCKLVTANEMSKLLGYPVTTSDDVPKAPHIAACNYKSDAPEKGYGITIIANYDTAQVTAASGYVDAVEYQKANIDPAMSKIEDLTDIGEKAIIVNAPFMGNLLALQGDVWLTATMAGEDTTIRTETLKQAALAAFNKL